MDVEMTISKKRGLRDRSPSIRELISAFPEVEILGGDENYALDVRVPGRLETAITRLVSESCDFEQATPLEYLGR